jgi:RNA polymerase sigma factor (sigma-70 family)
LRPSPEQQAAQQALDNLVRHCLAGDQHAWQQLVASQHRRIYAICYRFTGSAGDAEDLTQEVFLKLYRNLKSFDAERGSFQTWITALARNLLVDHFRRTHQDRATASLDASLSLSADGNGPPHPPTHPPPPPAARPRRRPRTPRRHPASPRPDLPRTARGRRPARPPGHGL